MAVTYFLLLSGLGLAVIAQDCSKPAPGPNMVLSDSSSTLKEFPDGTKVSFTCNFGYASIGGSPSITCTAGSWSTVRMVCEIKSCGALPDVPNGDIEYLDGMSFGQSAVVTCKRGFLMIPVSGGKITCGAEGWLDRLPVCQAVSCDKPSAVVDGNFSPEKDSYEYRDSILYSCLKDYTVNGTTSATCLENGKFSSKPPTCVKVSCKDPEILNAEFSDGSRPPYGYKSSVTYKCKAGYQMKGSGTVTCGIDSQWSPALPTCEPKNCSRPVVGANMVLKDQDDLSQNFIHGTQVTFACDVGYKPDGGSAVSTCAAGTWSPVTLTCKIQMCSTPDGGPNTILKDKDQFAQSFPHGTQVTFACVVGSRPDGGAAVSTCTAGTWSPVALKCQIIVCEKLEIENAEPTGSSPPYKYKDKLTYTCKSGYEMSGGPTQILTCETTGKWSPQPQKCERTGNHGNNHKMLLGVIFGVIGIVAIIALGLYCCGVPAFIKKKQGSSRGFPVNDATNAEEVALS